MRHKQKQTISTLLEVFACEKLLPLLFFIRLILFFSFVFACGVRKKFFLKKIWKSPDNLIYYTTTIILFPWTPVLRNL